MLGRMEMENVLKGLIWLAILVNLASAVVVSLHTALRRRNRSTDTLDVLMFLPVVVSLMLAVLGGAAGFVLASGVLADMRQAPLYGGLGLLLWAWLGVLALTSHFKNQT